MEENEIATIIIGAAIEVHKAIGPGLLESAYQQCLIHELQLNNIPFEVEVPVPLSYKGQLIGEAYRLDLLIGNKLIVELKTVEKINAVHKAQLLTYLRLTGRRLGLLINFNTAVLKDGISRVVNNL